MKKTALFLIVCLCVLCLFSCSNDSAPDGMQLCRGGDAYGYDFYVPEGWTNSYFGEIAGAYVTATNPTCVSLVKIDPDTEDKAAYFEAHRDEFPYPISDPVVEEVTFGNADDAKSFLYTYAYGENRYKALQIIATFEEDTYLFTYNSFDEPYDDTDQSCYDYYFQYVKEIFTNVKFYSLNVKDEKAYETDSDGYSLVTNKKVNRFDLWMSPSFSLFSSDGMVTMKTEDQATLTMTEATSTGVAVNTYFEDRISALEGIVGEVTVIPENQEAKIGNASQALSYEYTYQYQGVDWHVYQIIAVYRTHGFVYTYTAPEAVYAEHLDEILKMAEKVTLS